MTWVLLSLFGLALVALAAVGLIYGERQRQCRIEEKAEHAKCVAHVASAASTRMVAAVLRELAEKWDTVDNEEELTRIRNTKYVAGGPSVVSLWMHEEAERIAFMGGANG